MEAKKRLAWEIVRLYHPEEKADAAQKEFGKVFGEKELPSQIPSFKIRERRMNVLDLLVKMKLVPSKSMAKRLVLQGGVKIDGKVKKDWREDVEIKKGLVAQVGRRKFAKVS